jgi:hypothetical protein
MLIFGLFHLLDEHLVDFVGLTLDVLDDSLTLGKGVKRFNQLNALLHRLNHFKREFDYILVNIFQFLHVQLKVLVIVLPMGGIDVQDGIVVGTFDLLQIFLKIRFDQVQVIDDILTFQSTENWQNSIFAFLSKLELATADIVHILASLLKRINLRKNSILLERPHLILSLSLIINNITEILEQSHAQGDPQNHPRPLGQSPHDMGQMRILLKQ